jgi:hypothetical protein
MKKVGFVLIVVIFAGSAGAATWEVLQNGNPYSTGMHFLPSDIFRITLVEPVSGYGGFGDFTVNVSIGSYEADSLGFHAGPWVLPPAGNVTPVDAGFDVYAAGSGFPSPTGDIMWFEFHVPEGIDEGTEIVISHVLGSWNNVFPPDAIEDAIIRIPEPMTIGLLAFGALGLMRHRKSPNTPGK